MSPPSEYSTLLDSGAHLFMAGQYYYRQLDDLAVNICAVHDLTDAQWREYLEQSLAVSKKLGAAPKVSAIIFTNGFPNAAQRRMSTNFLAANEVPKLERIAVFTESVMLRGAMTALSWFLPETTLRPFDIDDVRRGFAWVREKGQFDTTQALNVWREGHIKVGLTRPTLRP